MKLVQNDRFVILILWIILTYITLQTLPKFDKEILKLAKDYEKCYQTEFSYLGRPIKDVLEETNVTKKKTSNKENVVCLFFTFSRITHLWLNIFRDNLSFYYIYVA